MSTAQGTGPSPAARSQGFAPGLMALNTFTLKNTEEADVFERRFTEHVVFMRDQEGFAAHQMTRSAEQSGVYVNAGWWRSPDDFGKVARSAEFQQHAQSFHRIVDVDVLPARVLAADEPGAVVGTDAAEFPLVTVARFTVAAPQQKVAEAYAAHLADVPGGALGWSVLGVALPDPTQYVVVARWASAEAWAQVRRSVAWQELTAHADVSYVSGASAATGRSALAAAESA